MPIRFPPHLKAAAELELRKRQKERAANCVMCEVEAAVHEIYGTLVLDPVICPHKRDEQDPGSPYWQRMNENMEDIYGGAMISNNNAEAIF